MSTVAILWAQYGPYHLARVRALRRHACGIRVQALELADGTRDYLWRRQMEPGEVVTLCPGGIAEDLPGGTVFRRVRRALATAGAQVCLLPSYWPKQSFAALLAAKSLGVRTVMLNESHAGTARASGWRGLVKHGLVGLFDAALVGGRPHRRYFERLGMPSQGVFTGYDCVDNEYFAGAAERARLEAEKHRARLGLPGRYFLSLGRFVPKKNLTTLVQAYGEFLSRRPVSEIHLVLVGAGDEETALRAACRALRLAVYNHPDGGLAGEADGAAPAGVHFFGFRQQDETPIFYALADAFILPSLCEEWGLVVNEAMACGLPVVVSETAGCAEDLLPLPATTATGFAVSHGVGHRLRQNGFVFDPCSAEELGHVLAALVRVPNSREIMGRASREIVAQYSCENFAHNALQAAQAAMGAQAAALDSPQ